MPEAAKVTRRNDRMCALTKQRMSEERLLRFVADAEGNIVFDLKRRLPGRGVWITASRDALVQAIRQKVFARALRQAVSVDPELPAVVEKAIRQAALGSLAMANKAAQVIVGYTKVEATVRSGKAVALVHASDAAEDGCRKLDGKFLTRANSAADREFVFRCFTSEELSRCLGRDNLVHLALIEGGASRAFIRAARRLRSYADAAQEMADE